MNSVLFFYRFMKTIFIWIYKKGSEGKVAIDIILLSSNKI